MLKRKIAVGFSLVATSALLAGLAFTNVEVRRSTKTIGVTTVSWNSSFVDAEFSCLPITLDEADLDIVVESGDAVFVGFVGKKRSFTPPKDVNGTYIAGEEFYSVEMEADIAPGRSGGNDREPIKRVLAVPLSEKEGGRTFLDRLERIAHLHEVPAGQPGLHVSGQQPIDLVNKPRQPPG